ncbi:IgGFc-binding protein-like isoform X2 [Mytilus edulis]|uniref:IgGFc-binding protein-like isoform X2 n=1 Tax=Mytilus edulis TaxID=6550 RepID=UPI0039EFB6EF
MLLTCNMLLFFLIWIAAYGNTLTISSTVNSTDLESEIFKGLTINSSCQTTHQCIGKLVCFNGQCQCSEHHIWNGTNCVGEKTFTSKCQHTIECDPTLFCIYGTCQCAQVHYWNGNACIIKKTSNETCTNSNECGGKLLCEDRVCHCPSYLFWNGSKCIFKHSDGQSCSSSIACTENLECKDSLCQCPESEYWDNSKCSSQKDEHALCNSSLECKATLQCRTNHCICCEQDFWNGQFCERKRDTTSQCHESVECKDTLHCIRGICQCDVNEYWTQAACAKNNCAIEQCLNGGNCQILKNEHNCICADGYLGDKCQYADGREKHFMVIFHQSYNLPSPRILTTTNRRGTLSIFYFANNQNITLKLNLSDGNYILDSNVLMTNGLHHAGAEIHCDVPIILYGFLFVRSYSEGFFVLPTRFLSSDYVIPSFTVSSYNSGVCQSVFALSSVYSNTVIEINFKMKDGSVSYNNMQYTNNQTLTLVLNKYTTFQVWHSSDLTGTRVIASKPVLVVSGNRCNYVTRLPDCQPFIEMVLPTNQLDNMFVIPYLNYRLENTVRVIVVNNTSVDVKSGHTRSRKDLKPREFLDYFHTTISYVSTECDVMVHIYPHQLPDHHGDAFMMTIPGINQYLYDYEFMVPTDFESFISVTVPTDAVDGFVLDGNFVNLKNIFSIVDGKHRFSSFSIPISSGPHHIIHREKARFGLWVYGNYTSYEAYGYPAGMAFKT